MIDWNNNAGTRFAMLTCQLVSEELRFKKVNFVSNPPSSMKKREKSDLN